MGLHLTLPRNTIGMGYFVGDLHGEYKAVFNGPQFTRKIALKKSVHPPAGTV